MSIDIEYLNNLKLNKVSINRFGNVHDRVPIQRVVGITSSGNNLICIVDNKLIHVPLEEIEIESAHVKTLETVEFN